MTGRLIYSLNVSIDGFVETTDHSIDFANVDDELHSWYNDQARGFEASLYGRRMYELMHGYWPNAESDPEASETMVDFARIWSGTPRFVFSRTLGAVDAGSRLVQGDVGEQLAAIRRDFSGDLDVGGANLAHQFIRAGLVDEYRLLVHPVALGSGAPFFPVLDEPLRLRLVETRSFDSGVVYLRYVPA